MEAPLIKRKKKGMSVYNRLVALWLISFLFSGLDAAVAHAGSTKGVEALTAAQQTPAGPVLKSEALEIQLNGRVLLFRVDTRQESWIDVSSLVSRRFETDQNEGRYERHRIWDFYPEELRWEMKDIRDDTVDAGELPTNEPLDQVSFLYFVRTLDLEVGETYEFDRYFQESGNPVVLKVLRRETVTVPAGTFDTIVVQPIIQTGGLFSEGGQAEVYFTDDDRRLLVQMRSRVPVIGSMNLHLQEYMPGEAAMPGATGGR
jgi:hypothetical protein